MKRHEIPIRAGLMANGRIRRVRSTLCPNPARSSRIAKPRATMIVVLTSITTKVNVTRMTVQNSGSSLKASV